MEPFLGQITIFAGNFAPRGWAFCDGALLPISQNTALFSLLGTIYGGDGRTTFALPDLRGRMPIHAGHGPGLSDRREGQRGGQENVTLTTQTMPSHNHLATSTAQVAVTSSSGGETNANGQHIAHHANAFSEEATPGASLGGVSANTTVQNAGGQFPHQNMPPFLVVRYIIALQGIFPSRS